jgi:hypothetical protein
VKAALASLLWLWQLGAPQAGEVTANPQHLRYERNIQLPEDVAGQACTALDATIFAHAASNSLNDLRLYASKPAQAELEVPFALTESGPNPETHSARVLRPQLRDGLVAFDLEMPSRPYTTVDLHINAKDFLGTARVWGSDGQHLSTNSIGTYAVFDLSKRGLPRSTRLTLPEEVYPVLHIELALKTLDGHPLRDLTSAAIEGANIPPSRNDQTIYKTVAASSAVDSQGLWSIATIDLPAHVPVERVRFVVDRRYTHDFMREVTVAATPGGKGVAAVGAAEAVSGQIYQVKYTATASAPPIDTQQLFIDLALGSNLRSAAMVMASVRNGDSPPLPLERVELQMRQRQICFDAQRGAQYVLRYGDTALGAPDAPYASRFRPTASPLAAVLGPERQNYRFMPRSATRSDPRSQTQLFWIIVLAMISVGGVLALQHLRQGGS